MLVALLSLGSVLLCLAVGVAAGAICLLLLGCCCCARRLGSCHCSLLGFAVGWRLLRGCLLQVAGSALAVLGDEVTHSSFLSTLAGVGGLGWREHLAVAWRWRTTAGCGRGRLLCSYLLLLHWLLLLRHRWCKLLLRLRLLGSCLLLLRGLLLLRHRWCKLLLRLRRCDCLRLRGLQRGLGRVGRSRHC